MFNAVTQRWQKCGKTALLGGVDYYIRAFRGSIHFEGLYPCLLKSGALALSSSAPLQLLHMYFTCLNRREINMYNVHTHTYKCIHNT